jgi:hypothetical protein
VEWLIELGKGLGKFFLNPLLYLGLLYAVYLGFIRVKRERKNFHTRVQDGWFEFRTYLKNGWLLGLIFSAIIFIIGFQIPLAYVFTFSAITVLFSLVTKPSLLSPAYTAGAAFFVILLLSYAQIEVPIFTDAFSELTSIVVPSAALLIGLLLYLEGVLIKKNAVKYTSPKLGRSNRGLKVGIHESKRLWMVPILLLIPADTLSIPFEYWPVVPVGGESFAFLFVPYWIGFGSQIRSVHPQVGITAIGKKVTTLSVLVIAISAVGFWFPICSIVASGLAIVGRIFISLLHYLKDDAQTFYFSRNQQGIVILDILPDTPAHKMELKIGEVIKMVNGVHVKTDQDFYEALQLNRAYCKLEVIDDNGENRFVNRALYEGEHHELGIITIKTDNQYDDRTSIG